jgi:soluble lytic murein transglycosylase
MRGRIGGLSMRTQAKPIMCAFVVAGLILGIIPGDFTAASASTTLPIYPSPIIKIRKPKTAVAVRHESRIRHARELYGKAYRGQLKQMVESQPQIERFIYEEVQARLADRDKYRTLQITEAIIQEANRQNMDPLLVLSVINVESKFNLRAKGSHGEIGLMQIKPDTAEWIARKAGIKMKDAHSLYNPSFNIRIGAAYIKMLRSRFAADGNLYLSAYNIGPAKLRRNIAENNMPKVYASLIMQTYSNYYSSLNDWNNIAANSGTGYRIAASADE